MSRADLTTFLRRHKVATIATVGLLAVGTLVAIGASNAEPSTPSRKMTLVDAACDMLNDGETPDFTFRVAKDLANDHPYTYPDADLAARAAVSQAQARGCG